MTIDVRAAHRALYAPGTADFTEVDVPPMTYLAIDGHGDPNTSADYAQAVAALYTAAYTIRAALKARTGEAWVVGPLEGLWSAPSMAAFTTERDKAEWEWTLLMLVPDWVDGVLVADAADAVRAKGAPAGLDEIRLEALEEGTCVQTLHIGAFDDEGPVLAELHDGFLPEHGWRETGRHHEIYLSDARRVEPARRRTILRQPVVAAS